MQPYKYRSDHKQKYTSSLREHSNIFPNFSLVKESTKTVQYKDCHSLFYSFPTSLVDTALDTF